MASPIISDDKRRFLALRLCATFFGGLRLEVVPLALLVQFTLWALPLVLILPSTSSSVLDTSIIRAVASLPLLLLSDLIPIILAKHARKDSGPCWYDADAEIPNDATWQETLLLLFPRRTWYDRGIGILSTMGLIFVASWSLDRDQVSLSLRVFACLGICTAQFCVTQNRQCPEVAVWMPQFLPQRSLCIIAISLLPGKQFAVLVAILPFLWFTGILSLVPTALWFLEQIDKTLGACHHGGNILHIAQLALCAGAVIAGYFVDGVYGLLLAILVTDEPLFLRRRSLAAHLLIGSGAALGTLIHVSIARDDASESIWRSLLEALVLVVALVCWRIRLRMGYQYFSYIRGVLVFLLSTYTIVVYDAVDAEDCIKYEGLCISHLLQICGALAMTRGAANWPLTVSAIVGLRVFDEVFSLETLELPFNSILFRALCARVIAAKCVCLTRQLLFAYHLICAVYIFPKLRVYAAFLSIPLWFITFPLNFITESPLLPLFTLPVFLPSFLRPKHWRSEKMETDRVDSVLYQQLVPTLASALAQRWHYGSLPESGFLLTRSHERLICILEILESGHGWIKLQIRGLEMQEPTSCHHVEAQKVDECLERCRDSRRVGQVQSVWVSDDHASRTRSREIILEPKRNVVLVPEGSVHATTYESTDFLATGILDNREGLNMVYAVFAHCLVHLISLDRMPDASVHASDAQLEEFRSLIQPRFLCPSDVEHDFAVSSVETGHVSSQDSIISGTQEAIVVRIESPSNPATNSTVPTVPEISPKHTGRLPPLLGASWSELDDLDPELIEVHDNRTRLEANLDVDDDSIDILLRDVLCEGTHNAVATVAQDAAVQKEVDKIRIAADYFVAALAPDSLQQRLECGARHVATLFDGFSTADPMKDVITRAFRTSLKVALDILVVGDAIQSVPIKQALTDALREVVCVPFESAEWIGAMRSGSKELFGFQKSGLQLKVFKMVLREDEVLVGSFPSEAVLAFWASTNFELRYVTNDDEERYSVQAHPTLLRNLMVQALEYPTFISDVLTIKF